MAITERSVVGLIVVGAVAIVAVGCGSASGKPNAGQAENGSAEAGQAEAEVAESQVFVLVPEDVATVRRGSLSQGVEVEGTLRPHEIVQLRAQVPGVVSRVLVDRGEVVDEGDLLAVIAAEGIRSRAASARAQVAAAEASLAVARRQVESARQLYEAGALSEIDLRTAEASHEAANGRLAAAKAQMAAAVEAAGQTRIRAPLDGAVSERAVNEGEAVVPGQALLTVVNSDRLELAGHVSVEAALTVTAGQPVEFSLDAYPGRTFQGEVDRVDPTADPETRQVGVYLLLPNTRSAERPGPGLIGGIFATGRILTGTAEDALLVPLGAVRARGGESFVWVIQDGLVRRQLVMTGASDASRGLVQVLSGLDAGERVLVAAGNVSPGMHVRIVAPSVDADSSSVAARGG